MKKNKLLMTCGVALSLAAMLVSCGGEAVPEIYLITDVGNIDDKSFNQSAWEGVQKFGKDNNKGYNYLRPTENTTNARIEMIEAAHDQKAKVVVVPGFLFTEAVYIEQEACPDMSFIFIDGSPEKDGDVKIAKNTTSIFYNEVQSGWLSGYFAAKEYDTGNTADTVKLGFFGGIGVGAVVRFGLGFCAGIEYYANSVSTASKFAVNYNYCGSFAPDPKFVTTIEGWYDSGVQSVFSCGGGIYASVLAAAKNKGKTLIGVDSDQGLSLEEDDKKYMLTSSMKGVKESTIGALEAFYKNGETLPAEYAGKAVTYSAKNDGVQLGSKETWHFAKSEYSEYESLFATLKAADVKGDCSALYNVTEAKDPDQQGFKKTTVNYIK